MSINITDINNILKSQRPAAAKTPAATAKTNKIPDIRITSQVYVDSKSRISVGLGYLLAPPASSLIAHQKDSLGEGTF
jgi:hypothetical protein